MDIWKRLVKLEKEGHDFGLAWPDSLTILQQIESECLEIREHLECPSLNQDALAEEIGDLMHAVMSLSWFCGLDSKTVLNKSCDKFENRLNMMKLIAQEEGYQTLKGQPFNVLLEYWEEAKIRLCHPDDSELSV